MGKFKLVENIARSETDTKVILERGGGAEALETHSDIHQAVTTNADAHR